MPMGGEAKAERVLELNPDHPVFEALMRVKDDEALLKSYAGILYGQAQLLAGLKLDDPAKFAESLNALMVK